MMTGRVTRVLPNGRVLVSLEGRTGGYDVEAEAFAGAVLAAGDRVALAELTAQPGSWVVLAELRPLV